MKSPVVKRSIVIAGHKTSVSLEDAFWKGLKEIARGRSLTLSEMVATIDSGRAQGNLSSALRLFVLDHYRAQISTEAVGRTSPLSSIEQSPIGSVQQGNVGKPLSFAGI
jgi:predicted DNA-binding ribbon-helix-helix protein